MPRPRPEKNLHTAKPVRPPDANPRKPLDKMFAPGNILTIGQFPCLEAIWLAKISEQEKLAVVAKLVRLGLNDKNPKRVGAKSTRRPPSKKTRRSGRKQAAVA
jgi:hypothetical protein